MLYFSLVLIIAGLVLLLTALFTGMEKIKSAGPTPFNNDNGYKTPGVRDRGRTDITAPAPSDAIDLDFEKMETGNGIIATEQDSSIKKSGETFRKDPEGVDTGYPGILHELDAHYDDGAHDVSMNDTDGEGPASGYRAVLYEDSSGLIDYEDGSPTIDTTLNAYKNVKRIGQGRIDIAGEGIHFRSGKRFFRFDYRKIENLKIGRNFFALFLKGGTAARLFLFDTESPFLHKIRRDIESYRKGTG